MTNYEYQKREIDLIGEKGHNIAVDRITNKVKDCVDFYCEACLFSQEVGNCCQVNAMRWAASEYKEPGIDWSKVPIDTPVLVSEDGEHWYHRYFAGTNANNKALVYANGMTSWTAKTAISEPEQWLYIKLAKLPDFPETEE
jgi:hypothetical protein